MPFSYRRIASTTLNRESNINTNLNNFLSPVESGSVSAPFSVSSPAVNGVVLSNGTSSGVSATPNVKFNGTTFDITGDLTVSGTIKGKDSGTGGITLNAVNVVVDGRFANGALEDRFAKATPTALAPTDGTAVDLVKNTFNTIDASGASVMSLPAISASTKGDFVRIIFIDDIADSKVVTIKANGSETLAIGSLLTVPVVDNIRVAVVDISVLADKQLNITGATDGDGGKGSTVDCYFNGSNWGINANIVGQGENNAASSGTEFA